MFNCVLRRLYSLGSNHSAVLMRRLQLQLFVRRQLVYKLVVQKYSTLIAGTLQVA